MSDINYTNAGSRHDQACSVGASGRVYDKPVMEEHGEIPAP